MKKLVLIVMMLIGWVSSEAQNYIRLGDASGLQMSSVELDSLEAATSELISMLPTEFQSQFKVYDFGYYVYNELMVGLSLPAIWQKVIEQNNETNSFYIIFGKEIDKTSSRVKWRIKLKLPEGRDYPCSNLEKTENIEKILLSSLETINDGTVSFAQLEQQIIKDASLYINKIYNCCDGSRSECSLSDIISIDHVANLVKGLNFVELTEITYITGGIYLGSSNIKYHSGSFEGEIVQFQNSLSGYGLTSAISIDYIHLQTTEKPSDQAPIPPSGSISWKSFNEMQKVLDFAKSKEPPTGFDYAEQNLVINHNGKYRVFTRMNTDINYNFTPLKDGENSSGSRSLIVPAVVVKWVLQRLWQAGAGIAIGFTMDVVVEKYFTYDHDCNWGSAVSYTFGKTPPYKYLIWATEAWLDSYVSAAFLGTMSAGAEYIFSASNESFSFETLFEEMVYGGLQGFIINKGLKGLGKVFTRLANELQAPLKSIQDDFAVLIKEFLIDPKLFKAWKEILTLNAHPSLRTNATFLDDFAKSAAGTAILHVPSGPMVGKKIGHTFTKHGSHNTKILTYQAVNGNTPIGQWLNDIAAEDFISRHLSQLGQGARDIPIPNSVGGIGRVYKSGTGELVKVTHIRLVPSGSGVSTAFPINDGLISLHPLGTYVP